MKASLEHRLWEILKQHPSGLSKSEVTSEIEEQDGQVHFKYSLAFNGRLQLFTKISRMLWLLHQRKQVATRQVLPTHEPLAMPHYFSLRCDTYFMQEQKAILCEQTALIIGLPWLLQVSAALESDDHFTKLSDDKWGLAIYKPLRWGFAGTGLIAEDFIEALSLVPGAQLVTAAARNKDRLPQAQEFAKKHGVLSSQFSCCCS